MDEETKEVILSTLKFGKGWAKDRLGVTCATTAMFLFFMRDFIGSANYSE